MENIFLPVSEIFCSFQGEGPFIGSKSIFLRLAFCNLRCIWCDTDYTWRGNVIYKRMSLEEVEDRIMRCGLFHLVITGGEPLLWQRSLCLLVERLLGKGFIVEVETNGTIEPELPYEVYFNVSPKLSNSGEDFERRIKVGVLRKFRDRDRVIFKFVIQREEDIREVIEIRDMFFISNDRIYLMPEGKSYEELREKRKMVFELSSKYGFKFTDRLHILMGVK